MAPLLSELSAGHTFETVRFTLDLERSRAYRDATGDALPVYESQRLVPPLAVAALALGELLRVVGLPDGTLHANQSMMVHGAVPEGAALECRSRLAQRSQRGGWIVSVLDSEILHEGRLAVATRATVLCPGGAV